MSVAPTMPEPESDFDPWEVLNFLWREWKVIAIIAFVSALIGVSMLLSETPLYTSSAQILLEPQKEKLPGKETSTFENSLNSSAIESEMAVIKSSALLKRVVERENLVNDPEFGAHPTPPPALSFPGFDFARELFSTVATSAPSKPHQPISKPTKAEITRSVESLKYAVDVDQKGEASVLYISVTSTDPRRAAKLANAVAEAYVVDKFDARYEAAKKASSWLGDRLVDLRKRLHDSEAAVVKFRNEHGLPPNTNTTLNQQQLADLTAKLIAAKTDVAEKRARLDLLKSLEAKKSARDLPADLANFGILQSLREKEAAISQKLADLASRYSARYPLVVNARAEQRDVKRAIAAELQRLSASVKSDYELAKARQEAIENSINDVTGQAGMDYSTAIALGDLERTAVVNKTLYEDFLQRSKITDEQSTFDPREVRLLSPALPPGTPSSPRLVRGIVLSLVIGLGLGIGGAFAKEKLDTGFTTPRQIESILGLSLLTSVTRISQYDCKVNDIVIPIPLIPLYKPLSRHSEMMRSLRLGIQMTDVDYPPKVIQVTSTVPGEGKTTISLALASSVAASGMKVLFIDADFRHPTASRLLNLENEPGLVDMLVSRTDIRDLIKYDDRARIWILPAGKETNNPADLLGSDLMKERIANFRAAFDYVVIDSAPLAAVIDPIVTSHVADKTVLVIRWAATKRDTVNHVVRQFTDEKKLAGVVFNMVDEKRAQKYSTYMPGYYGDKKYYSN